MTPAYAYLFASKVIRMRLRSYADAGHEWAIKRTWKYLTKDQDTYRLDDKDAFDGKLVGKIASASAKTWLKEFIVCRRCDGKGCEPCQDTGQRFHEEPLDLHDLTTSSITPTEDYVFAKMELEERMREYERTQVTPDAPRGLQWLVTRLPHSLTPAEAYEDYQCLLREGL